MARRKFARIDFEGATPQCCLSTGGAATGADTTVTNCVAGGHEFQWYNAGANTTRKNMVPVVDANCTNGCYLPSTNSDNVGFQMAFGSGAISNADHPGCFTVGTDPAFYMKAKIGIPDISDYDGFFVGFVEPAAYVATAAFTTNAHVVAAFDEKAGIALGDNAGDIDTMTSLNNVDVSTDVTVTDWADDAVKTLEVYVSAAGAVTYKIDGTAISDAVAFSFAATTVVQPFIMAVKAAAVADTPPIIEYIEWGYQ